MTLNDFALELKATADELRARSVADIGAFWDAVVHDLGIEFRAPYSRTALLLLRPTMSRLEGGAMTYVVSEPA